MPRRRRCDSAAMTGSRIDFPLARDGQRESLAARCERRDVRAPT
jgi:hypothetical protein